MRLFKSESDRQSVNDLQNRWFPADKLAHKIFKRKISATIKQNHIVLDAGCGAKLRFLKEIRGKVSVLIGIDLGGFQIHPEGINLIKGNITHIPLRNNLVDLVMSRYVLEHLKNPVSVFQEIHRILKPDGSFIFLIPNMYGYAPIISRLIPPRFYNWVLVNFIGKKPGTFYPTFYKCNTYSSIKKISDQTGFNIAGFEYLKNYPQYMMQNRYSFIIGTIYEKLNWKFKSLNFLRPCLMAHLVKSDS